MISLHKIKQLGSKYKIQPYGEDIIYFKKMLNAAKDENDFSAIIKQIYMTGYEEGYLDSLNRKYSNVVKLNRED